MLQISNKYRETKVFFVWWKSKKLLKSDDKANNWNSGKIIECKVNTQNLAVFRENIDRLSPKFTSRNQGCFLKPQTLVNLVYQTLISRYVYYKERHRPHCAEIEQNQFDRQLHRTVFMSNSIVKHSIYTECTRNDKTFHQFNKNSTCNSNVITNKTYNQEVSSSSKKLSQS